eukprot:1905814-Rhodomonas_salina.2
MHAAASNFSPPHRMCSERRQESKLGKPSPVRRRCGELELDDLPPNLVLGSQCRSGTACNTKTMLVSFVPLLGSSTRRFLVETRSMEQIILFSLTLSLRVRLRPESRVTPWHPGVSSS